MNSESKTASIGIVSLVCLVIGNMIGAGLYVGSTYALESLGDARLVLLAWGIGGVHAICGSIAYAALAKRLPVSGGEYSFLSHFVRPALGFMAGWISLVAGFTAPIATAALLFGEYACGSGQDSELARIIATIAIVVGAVFHLVNLRTGSWLNNVIVGLKFIGFALFIACCMYYLSGHQHSGVYVAAGAQPSTSPWLARLSEPSIQTAMMVTLFYVALSYTGFNASIYIAGEFVGRTDTPEKKSESTSIVPRSMIVACVCVTIVYLVLNYLFLYCAEPEVIVNGRDYFVSDVAFNVGGVGLRWVMRTTIAFSAATSILALLATGPQVYAQMARDGKLPKWLISTDGVPRYAIALQAILSCSIVWLSNVLDMIKYLGITLTACGALATSTLWLARKEIRRRGEVRWYEDLSLAIYLAGAIAMIVAAYWIDRVRPQFWCCIATFASGLVIFYLSKSKRIGEIESSS